jgi:hypothetical protein
MITVTGIAGRALEFFSGIGRVAANPLLGTWKLKSYVETTEAGETLTPYGEHPTGYLGYSADGRMRWIGITDGRTGPAGAAVTDEERAMLYQTMFAYAGTYTVEDSEVIHHVDISWNEVWTGTDQVRFYRVNGDILVITANAINPSNQKESHFVSRGRRSQARADTEKADSYRACPTITETSCRGISKYRSRGRTRW